MHLYHSACIVLFTINIIIAMHVQTQIHACASILCIIEKVIIDTRFVQVPRNTSFGTHCIVKIHLGKVLNKKNKT